MAQVGFGDRKQVPCRVPVDQYDALRERAAAVGLNMNAYMRQLVSWHLQQPPLQWGPHLPEEALFERDVAK